MRRFEHLVNRLGWALISVPWRTHESLMRAERSNWRWRLYFLGAELHNWRWGR